ncbi:hypothetical protein F4821DRAFT_255270 [Hypoxylon rubiginosum]|uniref:Uncharacterized protein n=1 Tax=Hypoxylon rubiginosum TaxID=110542 RepID=A0ACC0DEL3_9PEZI|nr:hypothetical protein F4821DRAFT_255270 [Hypoxylon rubiginosum]
MTGIVTARRPTYHGPLLCYKRRSLFYITVAAQTVQVAHLNAKVSYAISNGKIDPAKPTTVLINAMCVNGEMYRDQMTSERLTAATNLLAIEPLGHGSTTCTTEHFTYWDTALVALQAMEALSVTKAFTLGTSQGG